MGNDYRKNIITTAIDFQRVLTLLDSHKHIVFDLETTGLSFITDEIVGIGIGTIDDDITKITSAVYIPVVWHEGMDELFSLDKEDPDSILSREYVFGKLKKYFLDFNKIIIAHNLKFDLQFMVNEGIDLREKLAMPKWNVGPLSRQGLKNYLTTLPKEATCADTMVMSWLLDENKPKHGLKDIAKNELGLDMSKLDKILGKQYRFHEAPAEQTLPYALMDIIATGKAFLSYMPQLKKEKLDQVFWKVEMPFVGVLQGMERRGMPINKEVLTTIGERCEREMNDLQTEIFQLAGRVFNINASAQLAEILHEECGLPIVAKTPKGAIKTDKGTLEKIMELGKQHKDQLKERHHKGLRIIELVLDFRKIKKVHGTYIGSILEKIDADGRLHAGFHHTGTVSGRLSSSGPNMQNLPAGAIFKDRITVEEFQKEVGHIVNDSSLTDLEKDIAIQKHFMFTVVPVEDDSGTITAYEIQWKIRDAFQEYLRNWLLVISDLSQMELRMTAHLTNDQTMIDGFIAGHDIHKYNASVINRCEIDKVSKEERRDAKAVSFGLVYGKTVRGFAIDWYGNEPDFWAVPPSKKNEFGEINKKYLRKTQVVVDNFFNGFPEVAQGIQACHMYVQKYGFVKMITGRKRRLPEIFSLSNGIKNRAKRQAFNSKVQGSSADYLKMAMIKLERDLYEFQSPDTTYDIGLLCQVHDK